MKLGFNRGFLLFLRVQRESTDVHLTVDFGLIVDANEPELLPTPRLVLYLEELELSLVVLCILFTLDYIDL